MQGEKKKIKVKMLKRVNSTDLGFEVINKINAPSTIR
jgi:hypothetical protein